MKARKARKKIRACKGRKKVKAPKEHKKLKAREARKKRRHVRHAKQGRQVRSKSTKAAGKARNLAHSPGHLSSPKKKNQIDIIDILHTAKLTFLLLLFKKKIIF